MSEIKIFKNSFKQLQQETRAIEREPVGNRQFELFPQTLLQPNVVCTERLSIKEKSPFDFLNEIMTFTQVNRLRLSAYDPKKAEWKFDFYYAKGQTKNPPLLEQYEYCINIVQVNGFIPMLDGLSRWNIETAYILNNIYPDTPYYVFESGNSYHVYWGCLDNLTNYYNFFSKCILNFTKKVDEPFQVNYDLIKNIDLRWIAYNMVDNKGGLRFSANKVVKQNIIVPNLIYKGNTNEVLGF